VTNHQTRGALVDVVLEHARMLWAALARSASPKHHRKPLVGGRIGFLSLGDGVQPKGCVVEW
jgi:hypothetical protein